KPHDGICAQVDRLLDDPRRRDLRLWRQLFLHGLRLDDEDDKEPGMRARFNVVRNAVETLLARVGKSQPEPMVVTSGADWKTIRKARKTTKYLQGTFDVLDYANLMDEGTGLRVLALLDALIFGTGAVKVYSNEDGQVCWQRTWRGYLLTDPREEAAGNVMTLYEVRPIDREVLIDMFPEHKKAIRGMP